jgi:hypothetical protein
MPNTLILVSAIVRATVLSPSAALPTKVVTAFGTTHMITSGGSFDWELALWTRMGTLYDPFPRIYLTLHNCLIFLYLFVKYFVSLACHAGMGISVTARWTIGARDISAVAVPYIPPMTYMWSVIGFCATRC